MKGSILMDKIQIVLIILFICFLDTVISRLTLGVLAPREIVRRNPSPINTARTAASRYLSRVPGGYSIKTLTLDTNTPEEILDIFCNKTFPSEINSLLYLDIKDDKTATRSEDYISNIAHQVGYPLISWNPDYAGSLEDSESKRVLQLAPTIYHQTEAMLAILQHYNWTHFVILSTSDTNAFDFITSVQDIVKRNNDLTGYAKKPRFNILSTMIYNVDPDDDDDIEREKMKKFLQKTPKDNRIFLLHSRKSKTLLEAAEETKYTDPQYMWILSAISVGIMGSSTRMPLGIMGVSYRNYRTIDSSGKQSSSNEFEEIVQVAISDTYRLWAETMQLIAADLRNPNFQNFPNVSCADSFKGSIYWKDGGKIYRKGKFGAIGILHGENGDVNIRSDALGDLLRHMRNRIRLLFVFFNMVNPHSANVLLCAEIAVGRFSVTTSTMKKKRIVDRYNMIEFTYNGMSKYVRLSIVNVKQITLSYGKRQAWQKVGQYLPERSGNNVKSIVEMNDITWPGNSPYPPKGKPERRHFSIATFKEEPLVMYRDVNNETKLCDVPSVPCRLVYNGTADANDSTILNGTVLRCCAGLTIDLLKLLSEHMDFSYDLFEVPDKRFGIKNEYTGQWSGLLGLLTDKKPVKEVDMVMSALKATAKRSKDVLFTTPYLDTGIAIMVSYRDGAVSTTAVLEPYDFYAWALILIFSVHSIGAAIYIFEWLSPGGLNKGKISAKDNPFSLFRSFWLIWAMLFGAAVDTDNPKGIASRFMANIWALFALMFIASYTANLAAFMITKETYYKLIGLDDWRLMFPLDHDPPFRFATLPNGSTQETVIESNPGMFEYMRKYNKENFSEAVHSLKEGLIDAFIYDATPLYYQEGIDEKCQLKVVGNWYARAGYSVGFPQGSEELVEEMNHHILQLQESGELERLRRFWLAGACHSKRKIQQSSQQLEILNFTSAFILLALGILYGVFLLACEHLYYRFGRKFVNKYDHLGFWSLVSMSMGRTMTLGQTVMEAIDFRKTHKCEDPLCERKLWNVRHELDLALIRLQKMRREKSAIENKLKQSMDKDSDTAGPH